MARGDEAHAATRPATPATAWRSRKTDTSGFIPARESLRATDSLVDPRESRAEALIRRAHATSAEGGCSCTRPLRDAVNEGGTACEGGGQDEDEARAGDEGRRPGRGHA